MQGDRVCGDNMETVAQAAYLIGGGRVRESRYLPASFQPDIAMIHRRALRGDKTFNPSDPVLKRRVLTSQIVGCRRNKDSDQP